MSEQTATDIMVQALNKAAEDVRDFLREATPKYTGETAARWHIAKVATGTDLTVEIANDSIVAVYIEFGTGVFATPSGVAMGLEVELKAEYPDMRPRFVVRGNMPRFEDLFVARVMELLGVKLDG
jgi:hypothetical protein